MSIRRILGLMFCLVFLLGCGLTTPPNELVKAKKYEEAIAAYQQILQKNPDDEVTLYNTACAYALWNKKPEAMEHLTRSVKAGFDDFSHIESDKDLDDLRQYDGYKKFIGQKAELLEQAIAAKLAKLKKKYGAGYAYAVDKKRQLIYVIKAAEEGLINKIMTGLNDLADATRRDLFTHEPAYYITILCLNQADFSKRVDWAGAGGFYEHETRSVISRNTGDVLKHEFIHALHFADFCTRGQRYSFWIGEGFAICFESSKVISGELVILYDYRINEAKKLIKDKKYVPWSKFMKLGFEFLDNQAAHYAQTRSIFYWLSQTNKLIPFYRAHDKYAQEDPWGITALESIFKQDLESIEKAWQKWILAADSPEVVEDKSRTFLGVQVESSMGGMSIYRVEPNSAAERDGLKVADVVTQMDGEKIMTYEEFRNAILRKKPGAEVTFDILRGKEKLKIKVTLGKRK